MAIEYSGCFSTQRSRHVGKRWCSLHDDAWELIFNRLPVVHILHLRSVCSCWHSAAKTYIKSSWMRRLRFSPLLFLPCSPLLFLPDDPEEEKLLDLWSRTEDKTDHVFILRDKSYMQLNPDLIPRELHCVGSLNGGWLLFLANIRCNKNDEGKLLMYNPLLKLKIHLPSFPTCSKSCYHWLKKAAVFGATDDEDYPDPIIGSGRYGIAVIYGCFPTLVAYLMCGEAEWRNFPCLDEEGYQDLNCYKDCIFAVSDKGSIDMWDFSSGSTPIKKMRITPALPPQSIQPPEPREPDHGYEVFTTLYIIPSEHEILLAKRCIGQYVDRDGMVTRDCYSHPYWTEMVYIYKLNRDRQEWIPLGNLGDGVIFVGGNQSTLLSARDFTCCKKNSVYFTDDNWHKVYDSTWSSQTTFLASSQALMSSSSSPVNPKLMIQSSNFKSHEAAIR